MNIKCVFVIYFILFTSTTPACLKVFFFQAEMESRVELEQRLKEAEEALRDLEKGLNSLERSTETEEQMKGNVTQLRRECPHAHADATAMSKITIL